MGRRFGVVRAAAAHPRDEYVLTNAASSSNEQDGIGFLKRGQMLNHERFTRLLAQVYSRMFVMFQNPARGDREYGKAQMARKLGPTVGSSNDPMLVGLTGALVVEETAKEEMIGRQFHDIGALRAEAISLLSRAASLDPSNRDWPEALEGARELGSSQMQPVSSGRMIIAPKESVARMLLSAPDPAYPATASNAGTLEHRSVQGENRSRGPCRGRCTDERSCATDSAGTGRCRQIRLQAVGTERWRPVGSDDRRGRVQRRTALMIRWITFLALAVVGEGHAQTVRTFDVASIKPCRERTGSYAGTASPGKND